LALTTNQPQYLHNSISVQPCHNTRSSSIVILARPPTHSSLKITNRSFRYAAPSLWNELPIDLREPGQTQSPALSPITHGSSSSSSPSSLSPLASSLTRSVFHSELKTWLFSKSFPPQTFSITTRLITRTLGPSNDFTLLNGCTGNCVRLSRLLVGF